MQPPSNPTIPSKSDECRMANGESASSTNSQQSSATPPIMTTNTTPNNTSNSTAASANSSPISSPLSTSSMSPANMVTTLSTSNSSEMANISANTPLSSVATAAAANMITPLRELNDYLAKLEEEKKKLREENHKLHDVNDKLQADLLIYSRFNCILENIRRCFDKGFAALQYADSNKACVCNEHLNLQFRRLVQEAEMELTIWQKQYDKLVYKYQSENNHTEFGPNSTTTVTMDNPLRHLNAALIGSNGTLLFPQLDIPTELLTNTKHLNGSHNVDQMNGHHNRSNHHSNNKQTMGKQQNDSNHVPNQVNQTRLKSEPSTPDAAPSSPETNTSIESGQSEKVNGSSVLKSSYDLSAAINFSSASFMTRQDKLGDDKAQIHMTNGHTLHLNRESIKMDDDETITPPPLIPPPPPPSSNEASKSLNGQWNATGSSQLINGHTDTTVGETILTYKHGKQLDTKIDSPKSHENSVQIIEPKVKVDDDSKVKATVTEDDEQMNRELSAIAKSVEAKDLDESNRCEKTDDEDDSLKEKKAAKNSNVNGDHYECEWPDCKQQFDTEEILIQHRRCHIRKSNYLCKHCSARMLTREELEQHVTQCGEQRNNERKQSYSKNATDSMNDGIDTIAMARNGHSGGEKVDNGNMSSVASSPRTPDCKIKHYDDNQSSKRKEFDSANSSEEEIEVEEVSMHKINSRGSESPIHSHQLKSSHIDSTGKDDQIINGDYPKQSNRRSSNGSLEANDISNYTRYSDLLYPNKRPKSFTISTPSAYLPHHHLASLSSFYPHLSGPNGITGAGSNSHPLMAGHAPSMNPLELTALMESGRISPLTLSMLAQQHQQHQHRFQQYFAAAAAQHRLQQQQQQQAQPSTQSNNPVSPPPSSPGGAENLTMPNSARSSNFSSNGNGSAFAYHRSSNISGLMGAHGMGNVSKTHPSNRILSAALSPSQSSTNDRISNGSPNMINNFGGHQPPVSSPSHPLFNGQSVNTSNGSMNQVAGHSPIPRSYTIGTPGSFSALAALAAAATSSAPTSSSGTVSERSHPSLHFGLNGASPPGGSHLHSPLHSSLANGTKPFGNPFDLTPHHSRNSAGTRHSPIGSPISNGPLVNGNVHVAPGGSNNASLHHRNLASMYGPASGPQGHPSLGPHMNGAGSPVVSSHLLSGNNPQGQHQLAMIAAAAAAAADNSRMPQLNLSIGVNNSEASRLTAAAIASLGALKQTNLASATPQTVSEYKRTRYSGIGRYRCPWPDCGYTPHFLRDLRRHMFKHTGDKKHKCDYPGCDFVSVWKTSLLQHQRKKHYGVSSSIQLRNNNHHRNAMSNNGNSNVQTNSNGLPVSSMLNGTERHSPNDERCDIRPEREVTELTELRDMREVARGSF
ncbi:hypothetical protein BLOT_003961 [Blomia tropicalis]|nr:hypothetical protein BLOT_003961 [Blomia tropicalis]